MKTCKETLLRKASDLTAHVAEVGLTVGGLRPSDTSQWVYRQSETPPAHIASGVVFCPNGCIMRTKWIDGEGWEHAKEA